MNAWADGPSDNIDTQVRPIPPLGIALPAEVSNELLQRVTALESRIPQAKPGDGKPSWWNDVAVVPRAVRLTHECQQFYKEVDIDQARKLLTLAEERAAELEKHAAELNYQPSWSRQTGKIFLGHRSSIDDTIQPLGVDIPASVATDWSQPRRLDVWLHGRDESVSEVTFLYRRWTQDSQYQPADTFVLHPWGRYSNAFRFAGEVDVLEAIAEVQRRYHIDPNRISIRGFSMGGAGCWHFAVHYSDRFFAANPGAGFCETERFLKGFQGETLSPTPVQRTLWNLYDCPPLVTNLQNLPTVAYSGGKDRQKEAADIMTQAAEEHSFSIPYVIHPESAHAIHADAKQQIEAKMREYAAVGRDPLPQFVTWKTSSLRYSKAFWLEIERMDQHWNQASVDARFNDGWDTLQIHAASLGRLKIDIPANQKIPAAVKKIQVFVADQIAGELTLASDRSVKGVLVRSGDRWSVHDGVYTDLAPHETGPYVKKPGLQGPIDDAFLRRFIIVTPTQTSDFPDVEAWCRREAEHAIHHWRRQFRGDAIVKKDVDITSDDEATSNLICFGTPWSNAYIAKCIAAIPVRWDKDFLSINNTSVVSSKGVIAAIYPNPHAPNRYLVFNSGFTYREYDYLNNARQTPKLGDWAVFDVSSPMTTRAPGKIAAEGFFDEAWQVK